MHFEATQDTPQVKYDDSANKLVIHGRSLPENAWSFYEPVIGWANELKLNGNTPLTIEFFLEYFNSSSGRYLLELLSTLERMKDKVQVVWISEEEDELMVEKGEEFSGLVDLPFEFKFAS
ncbi:MAG: DUF1987 domain-containing protein [Flavobacteriales bacterium]|nr:DUF1987 domain-containing protein [Flavobacteriales bacterium]